MKEYVLFQTFFAKLGAAYVVLFQKEKSLAYVNV